MSVTYNGQEAGGCNYEKAAFDRWQLGPVQGLSCHRLLNAHVHFHRHSDQCRVWLYQHALQGAESDQSGSDAGGVGCRKEDLPA